MIRRNRFPGGRGWANEVGNRVGGLLQRDAKAIVVLDVSRVEGVSHSFADERLAPLSELLERGSVTRGLSAHCPSEVREELALAASMCGLAMPGVAKKFCPSARVIFHLSPALMMLIQKCCVKCSSATIAWIMVFCFSWSQIVSLKITEMFPLISLSHI